MLPQILNRAFIKLNIINKATHVELKTTELIAPSSNQKLNTKKLITYESTECKQRIPHLNNYNCQRRR